MTAAHVRGALDPSSEGAAALDRRMRERLEASLRYILAEVCEALALESSALDVFLVRLNAGPVPPIVFGAYFELVPSIENGDWDEAREFLSEIAAAPNHFGGPLLVDFAETGAHGRYRRLMNTDPDSRFEILPPPPELARASRQNIEAAFALMDRGDPALADEIRQLLREIVLAVGPVAPGSMTFDGASSFMLWGAIVLNARMNTTRLDMVQALAHESGHNLLFGFCSDGPLVENDDEPRYTSPLRQDLRPMDGIVHAAFVTARMHRAVAQLVRAKVLSADETEAARRALADHARNFANGLETVDRHARLTVLGQSVMGDARKYMTAAMSGL